MSVIQERGYSKYIKHPPAGSATPLANGDTIDSGIATVIDSNIGTMQTESCRQLVFSLGPGIVTALDYTNGSPFAGIADLAPTDAGHAPSQSVVGAIPWDRRTARRFGPFYAVADRDPGTGGPCMRKVVMEMNVTMDVACTHSDFYFLLTTAESARDIADGNVLSFAHQSLGAGVSGQKFITPASTNQTGAGDALTVTPTIDASLYTPTFSRLDTTNGNAESLVFPYWVWFGYLFQSGSNYVDSFCAFETR